MILPCTGQPKRVLERAGGAVSTAFGGLDAFATFVLDDVDAEVDSGAGFGLLLVPVVWRSTNSGGGADR